MERQSHRDWNEGKRRHIELSDAVAAVYDELYEQANFATGSYMEYELAQLRELCKAAPDHEIAVDLGCGTGRHSFMLARHFNQVFAYDISQGMIDQCERNKLARGLGNVSFGVADVEHGLPHLADGKAALISCSFGMGSFVEELASLFKTVRRLLKPRGVVAFSWYNEQALVNGLNLSWRPALAARVVPGERALIVDFEGQVRRISALAYTVNDLRDRLRQSFEEVSITTYPTLTALFPQQLFEEERARQLCRHVDQLLSDKLDVAAGPYIFATARRSGRPSRSSVMGYQRVLELFSVHGITPHLQSHAPVRTMDDVRDLLPELDPGMMVKSVLIARQQGEGQNEDHDPLVLVAVPADHDVSFTKVARLLGVPKRQLYMAHARQLEERTGFDLGAIPPFAMPKNVLVYLDERLSRRPELWTGTGKTTESLRLTLDELRRLSTFSVADLAREQS